jgi:hypothetical protein
VTGAAAAAPPFPSAAHSLPAGPFAAAFIEKNDLHAGNDYAIMPLQTQNRACGLFASLCPGEFPSGQWEQTVNLLHFMLRWFESILAHHKVWS